MRIAEAFSNTIPFQLFSYLHSHVADDCSVQDPLTNLLRFRIPQNLPKGKTMDPFLSA